MDLSTYETKVNWKGVRAIDTSTLASKANLTRLRTNVDKLNVYKLKTIPADFSKLSSAVDDVVVKKTMYDKLVIKTNTIKTKIPSNNGSVTKTQCNSEY